MSQSELNFSPAVNEFRYRKQIFEEYKKKKYYLEPENEPKLEKELRDFEDEIKKYKYYMDLPMY
jgi:hypothetical protein